MKNRKRQSRVLARRLATRPPTAAANIGTKRSAGTTYAGSANIKTNPHKHKMRL